jgi:hypothetical protein
LPAVTAFLLSLHRMDILRWLQEWYAAQCDGEWEFQEGVKLLSVSNPGWSVEISVVATPLADVTIPFTKVYTSADDWYGYFLEDAVFVGSGDPAKLGVILEVFRSLVENGLPTLGEAELGR